MFRGMKKIHKIFVSAAGAVLSAAMMLMTLGGCADILNLTPTNTVASANVWQDASLARSAVLGVYNEFYARYSYGGGDWWGETFETYSSVMDNDKNWRENVTVCYGSATPSSGTFSNMYKYYYTFVFRANDVISHIDQVPDMDAEEKARLKAEAKFLRGYAYMVLNILWRGVPLYLEYLDNPGDANRPRSSEEQVWNAVITDFTDCINEPSLPDKYPAGSNDYGRVTKGAAYAFRGQAYQFLAAAADNPDEYLKTALSDFEEIEKLGYSLYQGAGDNSYSELFKPANEQCDEIIFSIQCTVQNGMGNPRAILYGSRVTGGSAWNNYLPNPAFVESFENADGSVFDWEDYFPEWNSMTPQQRNQFYNSIEKQFLPHMTTEGVPALCDGRRWQRQAHIYESPFYYIDYCLAQFTALQFLALSVQDYKSAFDKYMKFLNFGGTKPFTQLIEECGLLSPFEEESFKLVADTCRKLLKL